MIQTFADTYFFLAVLNPDDAAHERAMAVAERLPGAVVTSQWVLTEVGDACSDPADRQPFVEYLFDLEADSRFKIIRADDATFHRGLELFAHRADKHWSLTDCISFVVMDELHIRDALTGDVHFRQAGFNTLL